jgi:hypothetical protein
MLKKLKSEAESSFFNIRKIGAFLTAIDEISEILNTVLREGSFPTPAFTEYPANLERKSA